jgi:hemerythrin-like domain-containing protein
MSHNAAIDMLTSEHKVILQVVEGLSLLATEMRSGKTVDPALLLEAVAFMREYADQCHHAKEEDLLFPALIDHGVPLHGCPIDALLHEHEQGRKLVREIADGTDAYIRNEHGAADAIVKASDKITTLYTNHIWKEDEMVFPMVQRLLPEGDREALYAAFQEVEAKNPPGTHDRFSAFASQLAALKRP